MESASKHAVKYPVDLILGYSLRVFAAQLSMDSFHLSSYRSFSKDVGVSRGEGCQEYRSAA